MAFDEVVDHVLDIVEVGFASRSDRERVHSENSIILATSMALALGTRLVALGASVRWMRFALALAMALGLAVITLAAQRSNILTNGRNLQIPINHGLPDKPLGFTYCRL